MKRFSQLTQTATEADLVAGNFLAIDVPGVGGATKKVPGNLVAPKSVQDNLCASIAQEFLDTEDYFIGDVVQVYGKTYRFIADHSAGVFDVSEVVEENAANAGFIFKSANDGYLDKNNGTVTPNVSPYTRGVSDFIDVSRAETLTISQSWDTAGGGCFACFYDENKVFSSYAANGTHNVAINDKTIKVPAGAKYARINLKDKSVSISVKFGRNFTYGLAEIEEKVEFLRAGEELVAGKDDGVLKTDGTIAANVSPYTRMVTDYIDVSGIEGLTILRGSWAIGSQSGTYACLYDANKNFLFALQQTPTNTAIIDKFVRTDGAKFIRITITTNTTRLVIKKGAAFDGYGLFGTFDKVGVLGGSLASGASFYKDSNNEYHGIDNYEYSWLKFLKCHYGFSRFENFSAGGISTRAWLASGTIGPSKLTQAGNECDAYLTFFGGNDALLLDADPNYLGTIADCNPSYPDTFYGNLYHILSIIYAFRSRCKIFLLTYNKEMTTATEASLAAINQATRDVAALFPNQAFLIDLENDEFFGNWFNKNLKYRAHWPALAYKAWAVHFSKLLDDCVLENFNKMRDIQFIGTNYDVVAC